MQVKLDPSAMPKISGAKVAILQAKWYREHIDKMVQKTVDLLVAADCPKPQVHILPGSLELPLAAQALMRKEHYDAIICFGAIMKGETFHFEMIVDGCIRGLMDVMLAEDIPIVVEVIPAQNVAQLVARSGKDNFNKGIEAALAAAEMIHWRRAHQSLV